MSRFLLLKDTIHSGFKSHGFGCKMVVAECDYTFLWGICPLADHDKNTQLFASVWHFSAAAGCFPVYSFLYKLHHSMPESTAAKTRSRKSLIRNMYRLTIYPKKLFSSFVHFCNIPESYNLCHQQQVWPHPHFFVKQWDKLLNYLKRANKCLGFFKD